MRKKLPSFVKKYGLAAVLYIVTLFALASLVTHTQTPEKLRSAAEEPTTGSVIINVPIDNAQYIILNDETDELVMPHVGGSKTFDLPAGQYRVEFVKIFGHTAPQPQAFGLRAGDSVAVDGDYEPVCGTPILSVKVFPSNAEYTVYNMQNKAVLRASGSAIFDLPSGKYWVEFAEVPGFARPGKIRFILANRTITTVNAVYDKQ